MLTKRSQRERNQQHPPPTPKFERDKKTTTDPFYTSKFPPILVKTGKDAAVMFPPPKIFARYPNAEKMYPKNWAICKKRDKRPPRWHRNQNRES